MAATAIYTFIILHIKVLHDCCKKLITGNFHLHRRSKQTVFLCFGLELRILISSQVSIRMVLQGWFTTISTAETR